MKTCEGKRRDLTIGELPNPGEYGLFKGHWLCCTPNNHVGNLDRHSVTEHDDGTITVSPSIRVGGILGVPELWHGWLKNGVWRECR